MEQFDPTKNSRLNFYDRLEQLVIKGSTPEEAENILIQELREDEGKHAISLIGEARQKIEGKFTPGYWDRIKMGSTEERSREEKRNYGIFIPKMSKEEVDKLKLGFTLGDWVKRVTEVPGLFIGKVIKVSNQYGEITIYVKFEGEPGITQIYPYTLLEKIDKRKKIPKK